MPLVGPMTSQRERGHEATSDKQPTKTADRTVLGGRSTLNRRTKVPLKELGKRSWITSLRVSGRISCDAKLFVFVRYLLAKLLRAAR